MLSLPLVSLMALVGISKAGKHPFVTLFQYSTTKNFLVTNDVTLTHGIIGPTLKRITP
jgi:hypothetical protein